MNNNNNIVTLAIIAAAAAVGLMIYKKQTAPSFAAGTPDITPPPFGGNLPTYNTQTPATAPTYSSSMLVNSMVIKLRTATQNASQATYDWSMGTSPRCKAYKDYFQTSTPDFIAIWNQYKNQYGTTIREDMDNTWLSGCGTFGTQPDDQLYSRFDTLNLA